VLKEDEEPEPEPRSRTMTVSKLAEGLGLSWSWHKCVWGRRFKRALRSNTRQRIMKMLTSCADILKKKWSLSYQNSVLEFFKLSSRTRASSFVLLSCRLVI